MKKRIWIHTQEIATERPNWQVCIKKKKEKKN